ncbi:adhesion G protein-coupled receptor L2 isoform X1 [Parasteatoda tepidariorum]
MVFYQPTNLTVFEKELQTLETCLQSKSKESKVHFWTLIMISMTELYPMHGVSFLTDNLKQDKLEKYNITADREGFITVMFGCEDISINPFVFIVQESFKNVPFFCLKNRTPTPTKSSWDFLNNTTASEKIYTEVDFIGTCKERNETVKDMFLTFPETEYDAEAKVLCPKGYYGTITWNCSYEVKDFIDKPVGNCTFFNCSEPFYGNEEDYMQYEAEYLANCEGEKVDLEDLMEKTREWLEKFKPKAGGDSGDPRNRPRIEKDFENVVGAYDRIIKKDAVVWKKMEQRKRRDMAFNIIKETEKWAWMMGCHKITGSMTKENIALEVFKLEKKKDFNISLASKTVAEIHLPENLSPRTRNSCGGEEEVQRGILAVFKNMEEHMTPNCTEDVNVSSSIVGVSVGGNGSYFFPEGQVIKVKIYHDPRPENARPLCVFLNYTNKDRNSRYGIWDISGCDVDNGTNDPNFTICVCNHMTNFAVLMDFTNHEYSEEEESALKCLSLICLGLSTVALVLTIIVYGTIKSLHNRRNTITLNLAICLLAICILVQTGLKRTNKRQTVACMVVSALLQYFVLSSFFWMLLEGVLLYKMVILVFETRRTRPIILYAIAYGIPFVIVPLSSVTHPDLLIRDDNCWISHEKGMIWSVLGPILLVIVVNLIIFCLTLHATTKLQKIKQQSESLEEKKKNLLKRCKGMFSLMVLLGFTWITGFLKVPDAVVSDYLFVILSGLQGVFLFLTQIIYNDQVRQQLFLFYKKHVAKFTSRTSWTIFSIRKVKIEPEPKRNSVDFSDISTAKTDQDFKIIPTAPPAAEIPDLYPVNIGRVPEFVSSEVKIQNVILKNDEPAGPPLLEIPSLYPVNFESIGNSENQTLNVNLEAETSTPVTEIPVAETPVVYPVRIGVVLNADELRNRHPFGVNYNIKSTTETKFYIGNHYHGDAKK